MSEIDKHVDEVFAFFETQGMTEYFGNSITQTSHAVQAAMGAEKDNQPPEVSREEETIYRKRNIKRGV